jgi:hypothetical protein
LREDGMMRNRYIVWIAVWEWYQNIDTGEAVSRAKWDELYKLLNGLWRDERKDASPEELAAHAGAVSKLKQ